MMHWVDGKPVDLSIGEGIALASATYLFSVACFNAGYFAGVPGNYIVLFSLTDLLCSNLSVLQFIFGIFTFACSLWFATQWFIRPLWRKRKGSVESFFKAHHLDTVLFYLAFGVFLSIFFVFKLLLQPFPDAPLALKLAPYAFFQVACIYQAWIGYKNDLLTFKSLWFSIFASIVVLSFQAGEEWLKHELADPTNNVTLQHSTGACLQRKVLRASSSGFLLYSADLKTFEYRDRSEVKAIYLAPKCT